MDRLLLIAAALFLLVLFCAALAYVGAQLAVLAGLP
jgi:hypothetical protein